MTIFERLRQKAQQAIQGVGNFIDRDKSIEGVQLAKGGLGNRIANTQFTDARGVQTTVGQRAKETLNHFNENPADYNIFSAGRNLNTGVKPVDTIVRGAYNTAPAKFMETRVIDPLLQVPKNVGIAMDPTKSKVDRAVGGLSAGAAFIPGVDDAVVAGIQAIQEKATGGNQDVLERGYQPTPLGDILRSRGVDGPAATITDVAELPLMLGTVLATGKGADNLVKRADDVADTVKVADDIAPVLAKTADDVENTAENLYKRWVNSREGLANWLSKDVKSNPELTALDDQGMAAVKAIQSGEAPEGADAIKRFTDELFQRELEAGLVKPDQYRANYLPQYWEQGKDEIEQMLTRNIPQTPGFAKKRTFETYEEGIGAGATPRYGTISDMLEARSRSTTRSLADREFLDAMVETGNAKPLSEAPKGWQVLPDLTRDGQPFAVAPEVAQKIHNYMTDGSPLLQRTAEFVSEAKQSLLSAGIPKTGWNFHTGVNVPARAAAARNNPFGAMVDSAVWNTAPETAVKYVESIPQDIKEGLLRGGITVSRSADDAGYGFKPREGEGVIKKARTAFDKLFSEAAFDKVLPAQKFKVATEAYERALKSGASQEEAFRIGATTANDVFGGINTAELGRSKDFQNVMRTFLLAPDWLESNVKIGKKTAGALLNPKNWDKKEYAPYRQLARNAAFMYTGMAMTNKALSGHWPWENGPGQEFNLATGTYDERGRERMVPIFGTAFDFIRLPYTVISSVAGNDPKQAINIIKNRLSPPASTALALASNQDYRGRDITSPENTPVENIMGIAGQLGTAVGVPSQVTNILKYAQGESTGEELAAGLVEAPLRYRGGANTEAKRKKAEQLKAAGLSNEEVGAALKTTPKKGQGLLSSILGVQASGDIEPLGDKPSKEEIKAFNESIDTAMEAGVVPNEKALQQRYFKGLSASSKSIEERTKVYKSLKTVLDDEYLSDEQKEAVLAASGASQEDAEYFKLAGKDQDVRLQELLPKLDNMDEPQMLEFLMQGRRAVGGMQLVSNGMLDYLYEMDYINDDMRDAVKALKWDEINNRPYYSKSFKGGAGGGSKKGKELTYNQAKALFNMELPKYSRLKSIDVLLQAYNPGASQTGSGDDTLITSILNAPAQRSSGSKELWF